MLGSWGGCLSTASRTAQAAEERGLWMQISWRGDQVGCQVERRTFASFLPGLSC